MNWFFLSTYSSPLSKYSIKFVRYPFASEVCSILPRVIFILYFTNTNLQKSCCCFSLTGKLGWPVYTLRLVLPTLKQTNRTKNMISILFKSSPTRAVWKRINSLVLLFHSTRVLGWTIAGSDNLLLLLCSLFCNLFPLPLVWERSFIEGDRISCGTNLFLLCNGYTLKLVRIRETYFLSSNACR